MLTELDMAPHGLWTIDVVKVREGGGHKGGGLAGGGAGHGSSACGRAGGACRDPLFQAGWKGAANGAGLLGGGWQEKCGAMPLEVGAVKRRLRQMKAWGGFAPANYEPMTLGWVGTRGQAGMAGPPSVRTGRRC